MTCLSGDCQFGFLDSGKTSCDLRYLPHKYNKPFPSQHSLPQNGQASLSPTYLQHSQSLPCGELGEREPRASHKLAMREPSETVASELIQKYGFPLFINGGPRMLESGNKQKVTIMISSSINDM